MKVITRTFTALCERFLPDAFVFCVLLTLVVFILSHFTSSSSTIELATFWGESFWSLNSFAMQMVVVLLTGHMLASGELVKNFLARLASIPQSSTQALVFIVVLSSLACWLNWGFGLIVAAILAVNISKRFTTLPFGLITASSYAGFLVWHAGLSGSIPLKVAGQDEILGKVYAGLSIPLGETIFSSWNLLAVVLLVVLLVVLALSMKEEVAPLKLSEETQKPAASICDGTLRSKLEHSRLLMLLVAILPTWHVLQCLYKGMVDINTVNLAFFTLNLVAHKNAVTLLRVLNHSVSVCGGIILQFPFYAALAGLMEKSGLSTQISLWCVAHASAQTLPLLSFWAAGVVNFFIPSGGGQWVVQGPVLLKAGQDLGVPAAKVAMAIAWGDSWTNMFQPFWLLPLLSMAQLKLKDVMGYCVVYGIGSGILLSLLFWLF